MDGKLNNKKKVLKRLKAKKEKLKKQIKNIDRTIWYLKSNKDDA